MKSFYDFNLIYLHRDTVDFRKSINGLSIIVEQAMMLSPFDSALFVFCNKQRDKLTKSRRFRRGAVLGQHGFLPVVQAARTRQIQVATQSHGVNY